MNASVFLRRMLPMLAAFLMASCCDPADSYWQKVADFNT